MEEQQAGKPFCGPWLQYKGGCGEQGDLSTWRGSVLFLTRGTQDGGASGGQDAAAGAAGASLGRLAGAAPPAAATAAPTLVVTDSAPGGAEQRPPAVLLDNAGPWSIWRFDIKLELTSSQRPVKYQCTTAAGDATPTFDFWVPAAGQPMHWSEWQAPLPG